MGTLWQIAQKINTEQCSVALGEPMRAHTTLKIGGPADLFVRPRSIRALAEALDRLKNAAIPVFLLGEGANILVGDKGIRGAVVDTSLVSSIYPVSRLKGGQVLLYAECGATVSLLCEEALARGFSGLENFYGMPGSVGGAIYMNARCYDDEISSHIEDIWLLDTVDTMRKVDTMQKVAAASLSWSYKRSSFMLGEALADSSIAAATFILRPDNPQAIAGRMRARLADRRQKHHFDYPSAGSMFKNNKAFGKPTGKILHDLGLRGYRIGDAAISPWHANIFVNLGSATARDMRALIEHAQDVAFTATGWHLEPEVLFVGEF